MKISKILQVIVGVSIGIIVALRGGLASKTSVEPSNRTESAPTTVTDAGIVKVLEHLGLLSIVNCLRPADSGILNWEEGMFATYSYVPRSSPEMFEAAANITWEILRRVEPSDATSKAFGMLDAPMYWLCVRGVCGLRGVGGDEYRIASPHEMRVTEQTAQYVLTNGYIPLRNPFRDALPTNGFPEMRLEEVGYEEFATERGVLKCRKCRCMIGEAPVDAIVLLSDAVTPLGIVAISAFGAELTLRDFGTGSMRSIAPLMESTVGGVSTLAFGCNSCHEEGNPHVQLSPPR